VISVDLQAHRGEVAVNTEQGAMEEPEELPPKAETIHIVEMMTKEGVTTDIIVVPVVAAPEVAVEAGTEMKDADFER